MLQKAETREGSPRDIQRVKNVLHTITFLSDIMFPQESDDEVIYTQLKI